MIQSEKENKTREAEEEELSIFCGLGGNIRDFLAPHPAVYWRVIII